MIGDPREPTITVRCLIVDDLDANLFALRELLQQDHVEVLMARSGVEALELLLVHDVALALIEQYDVTQIPVFRGKEPVGTLFDNDILKTALADPTAVERPVEEWMAEPLPVELEAVADVHLPRPSAKRGDLHHLYVELLEFAGHEFEHMRHGQFSCKGIERGRRLTRLP